MFVYLQSERYLTDNEYYQEQKKYKALLPIALINLVFLTLIFVIDTQDLKYSMLLILSFTNLFSPFALIPRIMRYNELKDYEMKMDNKVDKYMALALIYLINLCMFIQLIDIQITEGTNKTTLTSIIPAMYIFVITRYFTPIFETFENHSKLFKE